MKSVKSANVNPIHIKLEYGEAIQSRKDILSTEMSLIEVMKSSKKFGLLREEELLYKIKLQKAIKDILSNIKKLQAGLPKVKMPSSLKHPEQNISKSQSPEDNSLESELAEIQRKLNALSR